MLIPEYFNVSPLESKTESGNSRQLYDSRRPGGRGVPVPTGKQAGKESVPGRSYVVLDRLDRPMTRWPDHSIR